MITVEDNGKFKETTLNEIPVGTTFFGEVLGEDNMTYQGLFLKAAGPVVITKPGNLTTEVVVVRIAPPLDNTTKHPSWYSCRKVRNYRPVNLTIETSDVK